MKADEERLAGLEAEEKRLGTMGPVGEQIAAAEFASSFPCNRPRFPLRSKSLAESGTRTDTSDC